jgi:hypothetical protein
MCDQHRVGSATQSVPQVVSSRLDPAGRAQIVAMLQSGASGGDLARGREQLRDLRQLKAALESDAGAIREAFEAGMQHGTIEMTLRQLSTAELRRLTNALPEAEPGHDSRAAFASLISRLAPLPFDHETLRTLRATLVTTGYQGDLDRFDLAYPLK